MTTIRRIFLGYVVIAMLLGAGVAYATRYAYTPIDYPGASGTMAYGINDFGQIVGWYQTAMGSSHGFLKTGTTYTTVDYPSNYPYQLTVTDGCYGINNLGKIVGVYFDGTGDHGFLKSYTAYTPIDYPDVTDTNAFGINASGQIVGYTYDKTAGYHGFLKSGTAYTSFDYPGAIRTMAHGINDSGQIVGYYAAPPSGVNHGFLKSGTVYTPIDYPGYVMTSCNGINTSGQIVGSYQDASGVHGFIATPIKPNLAPIYQLLLLD